MKWLLKFFKSETLWREIIIRETPDVSDEVEAVNVWSAVFGRTPELLDYLKKREIRLLKSGTLADKKSDFILGQIAENRLWTRFEPKNIPEQKVDDVIKKKLPTLEQVLGRWNKNDANQGKAEAGVRVQGTEKESAAGARENEKKEGGQAGQ